MRVGGHIAAALTRRRSNTLLSAAVLVTLGAAAVPVVVSLDPTGQAVAAQGNGQSNDNCVSPSNNTGNCISTFGVVVGSVNPIYPTQTRSMPVTFSNPNSFDILVDSYTVSVAVPKGSTCPAGSLAVPTGPQRPTPRPVVAAKKSAGITIPVTLLNSAPNSCKNVAFAVTVAATGVKK